MGQQRVIAVMPAYDAAATLKKTHRDIPPGSVNEVLLAEDASRDKPVEIARVSGPGRARPGGLFVAERDPDP
jgi:glycosyltransferase involved in cell wall biosynthesis